METDNHGFHQNSWLNWFLNVQHQFKIYFPEHYNVDIVYKISKNSNLGNEFNVENMGAVNCVAYHFHKFIRTIYQNAVFFFGSKDGFFICWSTFHFQEIQSMAIAKQNWSWVQKGTTYLVVCRNCFCQYGINSRHKIWSLQWTFRQVLFIQNILCNDFHTVTLDFLETLIFPLKMKVQGEM